jgi:hypothetical protein
MNLAILKVIPWREIYELTTAVRSMVASRRRAPPESAVPTEDAGREEILQRIATIESLQRAQAEAFAKMAEQGEKLAQAVGVLSARVVLLAWVAGASLLLSLVLAGRLFLS